MHKELTVNEAQSKAITHGAGPMLVLAGPGSGKTFVITQRIKHLITQDRISPESILVITFTKAAALEMQQRFRRIMDEDFYPVVFGTFHSIFFHILRQVYSFNASSIVKESEKYRILAEILKKIPNNQVNQIHIKAEDGSTSFDTEYMSKVLSEISRLKNLGANLASYESEVCPKEEFLQIYREYQLEMRSRKKVDFDDMLLLCRQVLYEREDILKQWQKRFEYILIDEFQDINPLQYEVIQMLAKPQDNIFVVGDDDQAIYGFRGSRPELMFQFQKDYPDAKQVLLNVNYRSKKGIVENAGRLIERNKDRFAKSVMAYNLSDDGVRVQSFESRAQQEENIIALIRQYMRQEGAGYQDIAIIYRTNINASDLADRLMKEKIPFRVREKLKNIYELPVALDVLSYIRYAVYGNDIQDFYRIMNKPVRYISRGSVPMRRFTKEELLYANRDKEYVRQNIENLYQQLKFLGRMSPFAAVNYIRKGIGYEEYLKKKAKEDGGDFCQVLEQLEDIQKRAVGFSTLKEWLEHIENYENALEQTVENEEDAIDIVTMHASKGLEWKVVLLPDCNEGVVPHKKAVTAAEVEEERRLFYVAMTRAKENLFIFHIKKENNKKKTGMHLPSRFIKEFTKT